MRYDKRSNTSVTIAIRALALVAFTLAFTAVPAANARPTDVPPSGDAAQAIQWVDARYREPLALPDLTWDNRTAHAAAAHVNYWLLNNDFGHEEEPGKPGFTGVEPWNRCQAAGAALCGEVAFGLQHLPDAVAGWLDTPYHGVPFLDSQTFGCAENKAGSVCDMSAESSPFGGQTPNEAAPVNTSTATVRMWPYEGATDVPVSWTGGETPDPLENYAGDRKNVGSMLFIGSLHSVTASLHDANGGMVPLLVPAAALIAPSVRLDGGSRGAMAWHALFVGQRLKSNAAYTFTVTSDGNQSWTTHFTTVPEDAGLSVDIDTVGYAVNVNVQAGAAKTAAVTISDPNGHPLARADVKLNNPWAWPGFRRGGTFEVCADIPSQGIYGAAHNCQKAELSASTRGLLTLKPPVYHGTVATVTLHASGALLGQRARVELAANWGDPCTDPGCSGWPHPRKQRFALTLRATQTFHLPFQSGGKWTGYVSVIAPAFTANGARYEDTIFEKQFAR
jgi:hypothetical protein